jgi:hypothetical protein
MIVRTRQAAAILRRTFGRLVARVLIGRSFLDGLWVEGFGEWEGGPGSFIRPLFSIVEVE